MQDDVELDGDVQVALKRRKIASELDMDPLSFSFGLLQSSFRLPVSCYKAIVNWATMLASTPTADLGRQLNSLKRNSIDISVKKGVVYCSPTKANIAVEVDGASSWIQVSSLLKVVLEFDEIAHFLRRDFCTPMTRFDVEGGALPPISHPLFSAGVRRNPFLSYPVRKVVERSIGCTLAMGRFYKNNESDTYLFYVQGFYQQRADPFYADEMESMIMALKKHSRSSIVRERLADLETLKTFIGVGLESNVFVEFRSVLTRGSEILLTNRLYFDHNFLRAVRKLCDS